MDEVGPKVQAFFHEHLIVVLLAIVGVGLLLYGLMAIDTQSKDEVVFEADSTSASEGDQSSAKQNIMVDVSGAVTKPGVYHLKSDARVQDAILAAGGMSADADQNYVAKQINLAAKITDGFKLYIPIQGESTTSSTGTTSTTGTININAASTKELDSLPGVGSVTSEKIISGRPYTAIEELVSKKIVTKKVFDQIKEKISVY